MNSLRRTTATFVTCLCASALFASAPANMSTTPTGQLARGEPCELAGKRLVFTTWEYVRPGYFAWLDDKGNNVSVSGNQGPNEARFQRGDRPFGIRIVAQDAQRQGPIWSGEQLPGSKGITITTLLQDGEIYKAWGVAYDSNGRTTLYYESKDGQTWNRPDVKFEVDGKPASINLGEGTVFIDPSAPPAERYKCVVLENFTYEEFEAFKAKHPDRWEPLAKREDVGRVFYVHGLVSPDGFSWKSMPEPLSVEHSDTQIVAYYDQKLRKYVLYTRAWMVGERSPATQAAGQPFHMTGRRSIGRSESDSFGQFPVSQLMLVPSPDMLPSDVLYTNCRTSIPGAPDAHLLFPTIWHLVDDSTSVVMAASHDGRVWNYLPGGTVFDTPSFGQWDGGCVFARPNLVELPDGSFVLPYSGYDVPHKYPRGQLKFGTGYMVWPKGRIVALQADDVGEFSTIAIMPPGRKLLINAETTRAGKVTVEVASLHGQAVPGRSFAESDAVFGDVYRKPLTWKGLADLGFEQGSPVILRFRLDRAKIFSLDFE